MNRHGAHLVYSVLERDNRSRIPRIEEHIMYKRLALSLAAASLAAIGLAGCMSSASPQAGGETTAGSAGSSGDALATASTSLGTIVVDGRGMTVYYYDKDTPNETTSTCTGQCIAAWPAVTTTSANPSVTGVTGKVGTINAPGGQKQLTLDGLPLYTYAGDQAAGDVNGQGLQGIWWVVSPDGTKITTKAGGNGY